MAKKISLGAKLRETIQPALDDERKSEQQLKVLDDAFAEVMMELPRAAEQKLAGFFNRVARVPEERRNEYIIDQMTRMEYNPMSGQYQKCFSAKLEVVVPVNIEFASFTATDITNKCPSYKKIHEWAREQDVSIKLSGTTKADSADGRLPVTLTLDFSKSYIDGVDNYTPNLPELPKAEEEGQKQRFPTRFIVD